MLAYTWTDLN